MPDDRFIHKRVGHSSKVTQLTDFEYRVWTQYELSADDYGVMRLSAVTIQADNDALRDRPARLVEKALERIVAVALVVAFEHQRQRFICQLDWQDFQKVRFPRPTINPIPPPDILGRCSSKTLALFQSRLGENSEPPPSDNGAGSASTPSGSGALSELDPSCARAGMANGLRLTAHGNGSRQTAARGTVGMGAGSGVMGGALPREHLRHVWCGRVCVPDFLHGQFLKATGADDDALRAFYRETFAAIPETEAVESDALKFWRPRVTARWTPAAPPGPPSQSMFAPGTSTEEIVARLTKKPSGASR